MSRIHELCTVLYLYSVTLMRLVHIKTLAPRPVLYLYLYNASAVAAFQRLFCG